jgi:hypothetical protein
LRALLLAVLVAPACGPAPPPSSNGSGGDWQESGPPGGEEGAPGGEPGPEEAAPPPVADDRPKGGEGPPILAAHNRYRADHCAPPLTWSTDLENQARQWATSLARQDCAFEHNPKTKHGENLAFFAPAGALSEEEVAAHWYKEIDRYNYKKPGFSMEAGHFTQLVWVGTRRLGCASVKCGGGELWVCNYDPAGNMHGAFGKHVKPAGCR